MEKATPEQIGQIAEEFINKSPLKDLDDDIETLGDDVKKGRILFDNTVQQLIDILEKRSDFNSEKIGLLVKKFSLEKDEIIQELISNLEKYGNDKREDIVNAWIERESAK